MAGPWEDYTAAPVAVPVAAPAPEGPWSDYAKPEAPKKDFQWTRDTITGRMAKGIYDAVTLPGDVAQGNVDMWKDGHTNPEVIGRSAELASVASPMSPAARSGVGWAGAIKTKEAPAPTQEALASASNAGYDVARNSPFEMKASAVGDWAAATKAKLEKDGILAEFAPDTHTVLDKLQNAPGGAIATGGNLISAREALRMASRNFTNPREKLAAERAITELDGFIKQPPQEAVLGGSASEFSRAAEDARGNYAASKRSEQIADALNKAELQTAATHSGRNLDNKTRQAFVKILTDDKAGAGFTQSELDQAEKIVRGSKPADWMRSIGNFLGGGGGMGMLHGSSIGAGAGAVVGGPIGAAIGAAAVPGVGYALKKGADASTMRAVERFHEMVRRRSPLAESMPQTVTDSVSPRQAALARSLMLGTVPQQ